MTLSFGKHIFQLLVVNSIAIVLKIHLEAPVLIEICFRTFLSDFYLINLRDETSRDWGGHSIFVMTWTSFFFCKWLRSMLPIFKLLENKFLTHTNHLPEGIPSQLLCSDTLFNPLFRRLSLNQQRGCPQNRSKLSHCLLNAYRLALCSLENILTWTTTHKTPTFYSMRM